MSEEGHISHDEFPANVCVKYQAVGENVAQAYGNPYDAVLLLHRLMHDEGPCPHQPCTEEELETHGHYLNHVSPYYTHVGIGIYHDAYGVTWLTEDFTG